MAFVHLFNPENDLALAHGGRCYTPPPLAQRLHDDGAALPIWYGNPGDGFVWKNPNIRWLEEVSDRYDLSIKPIEMDGDAAPWGWSLDARRQMIAAGVKSVLSEEHIDRLRQLSHRRTTKIVMTKLHEVLPYEMPEVPYEAFSVDDVVAYVASHPGCYIKAPWSSSGRGVVCADLLSGTELRRRMDGTIRRQGSVMCEVGLDKVMDFAMLFYSDGVQVKYVGLSCFFNERGAAYAGNIIAPQSQLMRILGVDENVIKRIAEALEGVLSSLVCSDYKGYLGVDMMLYNGLNGVAIAPCIEVNLRMTMGVVAMKWGERFLAEGSRAVMRVAYGAEYRKIDVVMEGGKLVAGLQNLIPESPGGFSITIEAECD